MPRRWRAWRSTSRRSGRSGWPTGRSAGCRSSRGTATAARSRVFAFEAGVAEDPATGSAALALGAWLVATGALRDGGAYDVVQGVEMGRPSLLSCTVEAAGGEPVSATVRGQVVAVAEGRIRVP